MRRSPEGLAWVTGSSSGVMPPSLQVLRSVGGRQVVAASFVKHEVTPGSLVHGNPAKGRVLYRAPDGE